MPPKNTKPTARSTPIEQAPKPEPAPKPLPENYKPRHLSEVQIGLDNGVVTRVALGPSQTAQLDKKNKHGTLVRDLVKADKKGPILLHLALERKYAWLVPCAHDGCKETRVARTSDIVGPVSLTTCVAHKPGKGGKGGKATPLGDGGLDITSLTS